MSSERTAVIFSPKGHWDISGSRVSFLNQWKWYFSPGVNKNSYMYPLYISAYHIYFCKNHISHFANNFFKIQLKWVYTIWFEVKWAKIRTNFIYQLNKLWFIKLNAATVWHTHTCVVKYSKKIISFWIIMKKARCLSKLVHIIITSG